MKNEKGSVIIGLVLVLVVGYVFLMSISFRGWGYAGYGGYRRGPSFWYCGGPRYYPAASTRAGSLGGPSHQGGGLQGGK